MHVLDTSTMWRHQCEGKRMCLWTQALSLDGVGTQANPGRRAMRLIDQNALIGKDAPLRHAAKRRRMKTVMREIMSKAGRMIKHAGRSVLGLGANESARTVFEGLYKQLSHAYKTSPP